MYFFSPFFPSSLPAQCLPTTSSFPSSCFLKRFSNFSSVFCSPPLSPFPFSLYFLSPRNFLFPYRNWERQGCVGGRGFPPRKVWGFGQNRSLISSKHRSNLNCLQALVSIQLQWFQLDSTKGLSAVVSLVLEKFSFLCAYLSRKVGHPHSLSSSHQSPRETSE